MKDHGPGHLVIHGMSSPRGNRRCFRPLHFRSIDHVLSDCEDCSTLRYWSALSPSGSNDCGMAGSVSKSVDSFVHDQPCSAAKRILCDMNPSATSFEVSFKSDSLSRNSWINEGTLGSSVDINPLTGTARSEAVNGHSINSTFDVLLSKREAFQPSKGLIIGYIDIFDKMHIEMDIVIHSFPSGWANIIHCTPSGDYPRLPAIFIHPDSAAGMGFAPVFSNDRNQNYWQQTGEFLVTGKTYHLEIDITQGTHRVTVNGIVKTDDVVQSHDSYLLTSITCYASNPWNAAADITISNLIITNEGPANALCFNSSMDNVTLINYSTSSAVRPNLTMEIWYKPKAYSDGRDWIFGHDDGGFDRSIILHDSRFYGLAMGIGNVYNSTLGYPPLGQWVHIVAVYSSDGVATLYQNGGDLSGGSQQSMTVSDDSDVGLNGSTNSDNQLIGCFAQIQMTNRVVSAEEVVDLYAEFDSIMNPGIMYSFKSL